jgi:hypothetical protein
MVAISAAIAFCAVTAVAASPKSKVNAPLYTFRMEQASSNMNFLPTAMNGFEYTTEEGYTLDCNTGGCCNNSGVIYGTGYYTCPDETCEHCLTYYPAQTCEFTCHETCPITCHMTCPITCEYTCPYTCKLTCADTCPYTCEPTCPETCLVTCATCNPTCTDTCYQTCCITTQCIVP